MKKLKYLVFLLLMSFTFCACSDDDDDEIIDDSYGVGKAVVNVTVIDEQSRLPISEVALKQTNLKISATTDENGKVTLNFDQAPRAIANLVLSHESYDSYTTTVAIGEVAEGATKTVNVTLALSQKTINYVVTFTVLDDSTFMPIANVNILGLETGADGTDDDGVANVKVPGPGEYTLALAMNNYDTAYVSATVPDEGVPGETVKVDCGAVLMTVTGGFRIQEVDLSDIKWQLDSMNVGTRDRGDIGTEILTKEQFVAMVDKDHAGDAYWARFNKVDFDYAIAASGNTYLYPLIFKLHYEEATYAPGCYRVEVISFLEPFGNVNSEYAGENKVDTDESYYDYKKKKLVFHFDFFESWCNAQGWDSYYYSAKE